jgi:hypothetical protein
MPVSSEAAAMLIAVKEMDAVEEEQKEVPRH